MRTGYFETGGFFGKGGIFKSGRAGRIGGMIACFRVRFAIRFAASLRANWIAHLRARLRASLRARLRARLRLALCFQSGGKHARKSGNKARRQISLTDGLRKACIGRCRS